MNENRDDIVPGPIQLQNYAATGERPKEGWTLRVDMDPESPHGLLKWKEAGDYLNATQVFNLKGPVQYGGRVVQEIVESLQGELPNNIVDIVNYSPDTEVYIGDVSGEWYLYDKETLPEGLTPAQVYIPVRESLLGVYHSCFVALIDAWGDRTESDGTYEVDDDDELVD